MAELQNDRLIRALLRQPVDRTPVWIMRQAGRYLPEYRATRARAGSFMKLCQTPELACEVTLQPLARFPLDAAILFSDILTIPDAMGLGLYFTEGEGPKFERPVRDARAIAELRAPDPETELRYVMDGVRLIRRELGGKVPLIGFTGSPWTLATYMVEGGSSREFKLIFDLLREQPAALHMLLETLAAAVTAYLNAQIMAEMGMAMMGAASATGENRAIEAAQKAVSSPLLDEVRIEGARGVLINITGGPDLTLHEVNEAATLIQDEADEEANIIFGAVIDEALEDEVRITVIATGFGEGATMRHPLPAQAAEPKRVIRHGLKVPDDELDIPAYQRQGHQPSAADHDRGLSARPVSNGLASEDDDLSIPAFLRRPPAS
jgi:uroporphyrinogen-III decarboxylase